MIWRFLPSVLSILLLCAPSAHGLKIFFDHDTDANPYTFLNEVIGPTQAPVFLVAEFDAGDTASDVYFQIDWDCSDDALPGCAAIHGDILNEECCDYPAFAPFSSVSWSTCLAITCACEAGRSLFAEHSVPPPGNYFMTKALYH